jgi:phospholipid/cholesterol/gamma-HCH transport system substrate-binding protein
VATKANKFLVGLFVLAGLTLLAATLIWLGASKFLQKSNTYVTYFNESVNGLEADSPVKYRGVTVGRVNAIRIAPDGRLVEVELSIKTGLRITGDVRARLSQAGLTGWKFVELDQKRPGVEKQILAPKYETAYLVIPSEPSQYKELLDSLNSLFDRVMGLDLAGISSSFKSTMKSVDRLFADKRWQSILTGIDSAVSALNQSAVSLHKIVSNPDINRTVTGAKDLLAESRNLLAELRKEVLGLRLHTRLDQANYDLDRLANKSQTLVTNLDHRTAILYREVNLTIEELHQTAKDLKLFVEDLRNQPSALIFSRPPEPRHTEEGTP